VAKCGSRPQASRFSYRRAAIHVNARAKSTIRASRDVNALSQLRPNSCPISAAFGKELIPHHQQFGKNEMQFVARVAVGLFLVAAAAPTASYADPGQHDAMRHYNQPNAQMPNGAPRASMIRQRGAKRQVAAIPAMPSFGGGFAAAGGHPHWISVAQQYKGTNPTNRRSLWCADFLNLVLQKSGMKGTSSSMANSFASYGTRLSGPKVGAIAVVARGKSAGHVGIVTGIDASGNPILLSGNHNNTVAEAPYSRGRIIAYVWPNA
jgi:uncharacterized protein (TIGR02594 family)